MACEAFEMKGSTESPDKLPSEMRSAFPTHALLLCCPTGPPVATSCPFCQLLLTVRVRHSVWRLVLGLMPCFWISAILSSMCKTSMRRVIRSRRIVVVECAIRWGHWPVLRRETHPNSLVGLPPGYAMPALLYCRPLTVAQEPNFDLVLAKGRADERASGRKGCRL